MYPIERQGAGLIAAAQLMQPLQQMMSMAGQNGMGGGPGDQLIGDKLGGLGDKDGAAAACDG